MRALYFDNGLSYRTDYPVPVPHKEDALIRITHAGICNTDIEITRGYMGFTGIPGHEFVGIVEKCSNKKIVGKRVVGEINIGCGRCSYCLQGIQNHCSERSVLGIVNKDGVFAEYTTLPFKNLHEIPDSISDHEAVFVEPLAAAYEIFEQIALSPSDRVCVLGDGKLGILAAQVLAAAGCDITAVGKHRKKLSLLDERGIKTILYPKFKEKDFDIVIECTGSPSGVRTALEITRPKGKIILKTTVAENSPIDLSGLVIDEISLIGSRCGPFAPAIQAIESGKVNLSPLVDGVFALEEGVKAFHDASAKGALKVLLKIH